VASMTKTFWVTHPVLVGHTANHMQRGFPCD
jgi:hypothetical protein